MSSPSRPSPACTPIGLSQLPSREAVTACSAVSATSASASLTPAARSATRASAVAEDAFELTLCNTPTASTTPAARSTSLSRLAVSMTEAGLLSASFVPRQPCASCEPCPLPQDADQRSASTRRTASTRRSRTRPMKARTSWAGDDALVCLMGGGVHPRRTDPVRVGAPGGGHVHAEGLSGRHGESNARGDERLVGRKVVAFMSAAHPGPGPLRRDIRARAQRPGPREPGSGGEPGVTRRAVAPSDTRHASSGRVGHTPIDRSSRPTPLTPLRGGSGPWRATNLSPRRGVRRWLRQGAFRAVLIAGRALRWLVWLPLAASLRLEVEDL